MTWLGVWRFAFTVSGSSLPVVAGIRSVGPTSGVGPRTLSGMAGEASFAVDGRRVVHETVDGEVILIQLERGHYYSLAGSGPEIWELLVGGHTAAEIVRALESRTGADGVQVDSAVDSLVQELQNEGLIEPVAGSSNGESRRPQADDGPNVATASNSPADVEFAAPVLEKYTDMQDYLLMDPIHEVGGLGWPNPKNP